MKAHISVDAQSGLVHTAGVTTGKVHDAKVMDRLIREDDQHWPRSCSQRLRAFFDRAAGKSERG